MSLISWQFIFIYKVCFDALSSVLFRFDWGGSNIRPEATGYGVVYFTKNILEHAGDTIEVWVLWFFSWYPLFTTACSCFESHLMCYSKYGAENLL